MQRLGFPVFPLTPRGKPAFEDYPNRATLDPNQIMSWMCQEIPGGLNVEVCMAYGMAMGHPLPGGGYSSGWDLDTKDGKDGVADWLALPGDQDLPPATLVVQTKSGGLHFIFAGAVPYAQKDGRIGGTPDRPPGIDVKGFHNFLVGAGSVLDGRRYQLVEDLPPAPLPAELAALLKPADTRPRERAHRSIRL